MPVDQQKCATFAESGKTYDELQSEWSENNAGLINTVAGNIADSMYDFNRAAEGLGIGFTEEEIKSLSNSDNWDVGGSDGYGEFGVDGEIFLKIQRKNLTVSQAKEVQKRLNAEPSEISKYDDLLSILESSNFYGPNYENIREQFKLLYEYEECHLINLINTPVAGSGSDFAGTGADRFVNNQINTSNVENLKQRLEDLRAGETELSDLGLDIFKDKNLEFKEQCFLLANIFDLAKIKERFDHGITGSNITDPDLIIKRLPYDANPPISSDHNATVMVQGQPFGFINNLTQSPTKDAFFEMNNQQLSSLQPMIRLYKVINNDDKEADCDREKQVEIKFNSNTRSDVQDFLKDKNNRLPGVGLKNFSFAYEGNNPFAIKKSITAKISIHANSFKELLDERDDPLTGETYRYVDLVLKTGGENVIKSNRVEDSVKLDNLVKLNFRLKAVIGWENPMFTGRGIFTNDVLEGIKNQAVTLNLTPTVHDFGIDDLGRVTLNISYLAYVEDYYDNPSFNIFSNADQTPFQVLRQVQYKILNKKCETELLNELKKSQQEETKINKEKSEALKSLIGNMLRRERKVYSISIEDDDIPLFGNGGPYGRASELYDEDTLLDKITNLNGSRASRYYIIGQSFSQADRDLSASVSEVEVGEADEQEDNSPLSLQSQINFFYAGDLVDSILKSIGLSLEATKQLLEGTLPNPNTPANDISTNSIQEEIENYDRLISNFKKLRVLLGPLEIVKPDSNTTKIINLGDVPISLKHFLEWLTDRLLNKNIETFTLPTFLNSFFNKYIVEYLNNDTCYGGRAKQRIHLHQNALTDYKDDKEDPDTITKICNDPNMAANPAFQSKCPTGEETCSKRVYLGTYPPFESLSTPILQIMGVRNDIRPDAGLCNEINYLTYFAGRSIPLGGLQGNREEDHKKGIWHYQIGKDRGIVKSINLQKTDSPGLAEVRFEQDGYDGLRQLRVLYDTTIKTYLDVSLFPGTYIYVEPRGFDPSAVVQDGENATDLTELGIGGYCMVWKSEHNIQHGISESTLYAKWVASRDTTSLSETADNDAENNRCDDNTETE